MIFIIGHSINIKKQKQNKNMAHRVDQKCSVSIAATGQSALR